MELGRFRADSERAESAERSIILLQCGLERGDPFDFRMYCDSGFLFPQYHCLGLRLFTWLNRLKE